MGAIFDKHRAHVDSVRHLFLAILETQDFVCSTGGSALYLRVDSYLGRSWLSLPLALAIQELLPYPIGCLPKSQFRREHLGPSRRSLVSRLASKHAALN